MTETDRVTFGGGRAIGVLLALLGVIAYVVSGFASVTALIPSIFGVAVVAFASLGRNTGRERVAVAGLGVLAVLGIAGSLQGVADVWTLSTGGSVDRPIAAGSQTVMVVLCGALLALVGRSVLDGR